MSGTLKNLFLLFIFGRVRVSHICYGYEYHKISFLPFKQGSIYVFLQKIVIIIINENMLRLLQITNTLIQIKRYSIFTTQRHINLVFIFFVS